MVRGFEHPQKIYLFDCCIVNADSPSLECLSLEAIFTVRKNVKKGHYSEAAKARCASFTPILATCDVVFERRLDIVSKEWQFTSPRNGNVMKICILHSDSHSLRGSRTKWRGAGVEDAAGLPKFNFD